MTKYKKLPEEIRKAAEKFDDAIVNKNLNLVLECFADDCEIELLGLTLFGKDGATKWFYWMYRHIKSLKFIPVTIMAEGNTFFEEFIVKGILRNGDEFTSKQSEVLVYENLKVKSLRLYFDRLDFADSIAHGFTQKAIIKQVIKKSQEGLA